MRHAIAAALALSAALPLAQAGGQAVRTDATAPDPIAPAGPFALAGAFEQGGLVTGRVPHGTVSLLLDGRPVDVARDGSFVIAFDRDAPAEAVLETVPTDGTNTALRIAVAPRAWRIERLPTLPRHPLPDAAFDAARAPELARIEAARAARTDAQGWRQRFRWPVAGRQSGWFGSQRVYAGEPGAYHTGADVAVPDGTPVRAPADGVVVLAADHPFTLEGNLLMIDHGMGLGSALLHLSRIDVAEGAHVRQGQVVGLSGHSGRATGPHVHWGVRWRTARLDPLLLAGAPPARGEGGLSEAEWPAPAPGRDVVSFGVQAVPNR